MSEGLPFQRQRLEELERKRRAIDDEIAALRADILAAEAETCGGGAGDAVIRGAAAAAATETTSATSTSAAVPTKGEVLCVDPNDEFASKILPVEKVPLGSPLTTQQTERYSRQMLVPGFGPEAQRRLLSSSVLLVGAGGLGSSAALYLAAAGFGRIGIVDDDVVEESNLHRQVIHSESSARKGCRKVGLHFPSRKVEVGPCRAVLLVAMATASMFDILTLSPLSLHISIGCVCS